MWVPEALVQDVTTRKVYSVLPDIQRDLRADRTYASLLATDSGKVIPQYFVDASYHSFVQPSTKFRPFQDTHQDTELAIIARGATDTDTCFLDSDAHIPVGEMVMSPCSCATEQSVSPCPSISDVYEPR
jgi:hypothetical protein